MSISGLLSNNYTSETLSLTSAPSVGSLKVKATRISTGEQIWNSGWIGSDVATSYPPIPPGGSLRRGFATAAVGSGVTIIGGNAGSGLGLPGSSFINAPDSFTAQPAGGSLGGWAFTGALLPGAQPNPVLSGSGAAVFVPAAVSPLTQFASCVVTIPGGATWVYLIGGIDEYGNLSDAIWRCRMNADGSLAGAWIFEGRYIVPICSASACMYWAGNSPQQFLMVSGGLTTAGSAAGGLQAGTPTAAVHVSGIYANGSLAASASSWPTDAAMVNAKYGHTSLAFDGCLFTFGGYQNSGGASAGFQPCERSVITQTSNGGTPGTWATTTSLAHPVAFHSMIVLGIPGTPAQADVFLLGGVGATGATAVCQVAALTTTLSSWSNLPDAALPAADSQGGAFANVDELGNVTMYYITGNSGANVVYSNTEALVGGSIVLGVWQTGPASPALQTSDMGPGGSVVVNPDGTETLTFQFSGPGVNAFDTPNPGDAILFEAQVVDAVLGALSPLSTLGSLVFGDPPTISGAAASPANSGQPAVAFAYNPGDGAQGQKSWRVVIQDPGLNTIADSGVQIGQINSYHPVCNPPMATGITYTVTITAVGLDLPYFGSTATVQFAFGYTPTLTPPTSPSAVTAVADGDHGWVALGWTNAANTVGNRVWYRRTGATAWTLLKTVVA
ncbi:MAG: hypothetical protein M3Y09_18940, partial [Actinomycetota bacterium]|nr:hypothetical protein [Actinomycetota bacterium]